jgi:plastocyanin
VNSARSAVSGTLAIVVLALVLIGITGINYVDSSNVSTTLSSQQQEINQLKSELNQANTTISNQLRLLQKLNQSLPVMNQIPTVRTIRETWYLSPTAHQDRFDPTFVVVNQGDTARIILIDNDTVAHDLVIGPPYNIVINATVPGLINDLTHQTFTTKAKNNSPGVVVTGTPGNVSATYSFVAKYPGVYEFVCTYHAQVGMVGYLVVLPNLSYRQSQPSGHPSSGAQGTNVTILQGSGSNTSLRGYSPNSITVVIGVNNTVTWTNNDGAIHTVTANDGSFDSGTLASGSSYSYTFTSPGTYTYHCFYHPWMIGTIVVKAAKH